MTALRHGPNGDFVYVLKQDHTVELRNVTRGEASVEFVAITTGVAVGEPVVTEGGDRLKDGARVQTAADRPAGAASGGASGARAGRGERASGASGAASGSRRERRASDAAGRPAQESGSAASAAR